MAEFKSVFSTFRYVAPLAGGLLRVDRGQWLAGFMRNIGLTSSIAAELWGLRDGLSLALQLGIRKIEIELDAKALTLILKENVVPVPS